MPDEGKYSNDLVFKNAILLRDVCAASKAVSRVILAFKTPKSYLCECV